MPGSCRLRKVRSWWRDGVSGRGLKLIWKWSRRNTSRRWRWSNPNQHTHPFNCCKRIGGKWDNAAAWRLQIAACTTQLIQLQFYGITVELLHWKEISFTSPKILKQLKHRDSIYFFMHVMLYFTSYLMSSTGTYYCNIKKINKPLVVHSCVDKLLWNAINQTASAIC